MRTRPANSPKASSSPPWAGASSSGPLSTQHSALSTPDPTMSAQERIEMSGHIIDSGALMKVMDTVMDLGGEFEIEEQRYGRRKDEPSYVRIQVGAPNDKVLEQILLSCQSLGANLY